ncbi:[FeFe] hydrogenase maturase subunit HydE [Caprobacter fermentans]|uniref:[FeFe] hydrogenase maturase subunit HydE n=1 Tax=Caproicibacter fermentans TaxID=2576756 RepID=A0A6N8HYD7_9FIRM|nr:[FeFe] hydrogenase H-cluster radical SAM maturase HydE [Caproicibacter fermentans]MVB10487.1 [FeFe] hydrogenase maturase subunit HydE [Caproicibacter fermentans]
MENGAARQLSDFLASANKRELLALIRFLEEEAQEDDLFELFRLAGETRKASYGDRVFFRGLIEFSSFCKNDCYYCGIRRSNRKAARYRLTKNEIIDCCRSGYALGFRTFVLQSGEDMFFSDEVLCGIVSGIKELFPECAVTLSVGERSRESYRRLFAAGTDRYLLRHETADEAHYAKLHPPEQALKNRKRCLYDLKELGYQVGAGLMVGSPFQTYETLAEDIIFLRDLQPHMAGIGPFIPHKETRFAGFPSPPPKSTPILLSLVRCLLPKVLLPATTALATSDKNGREKGLLAGANVVMPNLTPYEHRKDFSLYDNKLATGSEAAEGLSVLKRQIKGLGLKPDFSRGDHADFQKG